MDFQSKNALRTQILQSLAQLDPETKKLYSQGLRDRLIEFLLKICSIETSKRIIAFVPLKNEPDILPCLRALLELGFKVALVRPNDDFTMDVRLWDGNGESLEKHPRYSLYQASKKLPQAFWQAPPSEPETLGGLVLVPGLGFSPKGFRLGRGGGYYDRFLPLYPHFLRLGLAFDCQIRPELPQEPQDVPLDFICTEKQLYPGLALKTAKNEKRRVFSAVLEYLK